MSPEVKIKLRYWWELAYAYVFGMGLGSVLWWLMSGRPDATIVSVMKHVYASTLQFSSVSAGFTATVIAIIFSLRESRVMKQIAMVNINAIPQLKSLLFQAFSFNWIGLLLSISRPCFEIAVSQNRVILIFALFVTVNLISAFLMLRMVRLLLSLFACRKSVIGEKE